MCCIGELYFLSTIQVNYIGEVYTMYCIGEVYTKYWAGELHTKYR